ncbi:helix-turn-helix domain-containing protein [Rhodoferax sp.]|jgi:cytoskeleton protein RodZ|uniref:helix-turn-helix domain-containing protein n=1 Tax=Rhodoferax sp. TaxID=50421 RepID=UPI003784A9E8
MSERLLAQATQTEAVSGPTAGGLLRQAREASGLHVAALAVALKVPVRKLEALEADRLDLLPDPVFVRALASSMCRTLKVDPAPILRLLPQTTPPRLGVEQGSLNTPFRGAGEARSPALVGWTRRPVVLAVVLLLVGAAVLLMYPKSVPDSVVDGVDTVLARDVPLVAGSASNGTVSEPAAPAAAPIAFAPPGAVPLVAETVGAALAAPVQSVSVPVQPVPVVSAAPGGPLPGVLVLRSKGEAWVEVVDAQGQVQVRRTLAPGESAAVSGPLPLSVVVGRADVTEVEIRGKAFSLDAIAKSNVARFEVK